MGCSPLDSKELDTTEATNTGPWKKSYDKSRQCIKKKRYHFADKGPYNQSYGFSIAVDVRIGP